MTAIRSSAWSAPASGIATLTCALRYSTTEMLNTESRLLARAGGPQGDPAGLQTRCASRQCSRSEETCLPNRRRWCGCCAVRETGSKSLRSACPARARPSPWTAARRAWQLSGYRVYGAAHAAEAAAQLEAGSGISSVTLDRLLFTSPRRSTCRSTASIPAVSWSSTSPAWSTAAVSYGCWRSPGRAERKSCSQVMTGQLPRSRRAAVSAPLAASSVRPGSAQMRARWPNGSAERSMRFARAVPARRPRPTPITDGFIARPTRPN